MAKQRFWQFALMAVLAATVTLPASAVTNTFYGTSSQAALNLNYTDAIFRSPNTTYADANDLVFGTGNGSDPSTGGVFTLQTDDLVAQDLTPNSLTIQRCIYNGNGADWTFQGGRFMSGTLTMNDWWSSVQFKNYTQPQGFATINGGGGRIVATPDVANLSVANTYRCTAATMSFSGSGAWNGVYKLNVPGGIALFEDTDVFSFGGASNHLQAFGNNGGSGRTNFNFSGNISLSGGGTLYLDGINDESPAHYMQLSGAITLTGSKTFYIGDINDLRITGSVTGDSASTLSLSSSNTTARPISIPATGASLDVGNLRIMTSVPVNPTNTTEDYFAAIRAKGGKVTVTNGGASGADNAYARLYLRNGTFQNSDFVVVPNYGTSLTMRNKLMLDTSTTSYNPTITGAGGTGAFEVDGVNIPYLIWYQPVPYGQTGDGSNRGQVNGSLKIDSGATLIPWVDGADQGTTFKLTGDLTLMGGSSVISNMGRTNRIKPSGTLYLGDGSANETITLKMNVVNNSGGPNEAWGFNADTVTDAGGVTLCYVCPTNSTGGVNEKTAIDWRNAAGTVQTFRAGSAGTVFQPSSTLTTNDGFVLHGPASGDIFTASSPTSVTTAGLMTFSTNLAGGSPSVRGPVTVSAAGTFDLNNAGAIVAASTINNGGKISGIGTFKANVTTVAGKIDPGTAGATGTLTIAGNVSLDVNSVMDFRLGTSSDLLNITARAASGSNAAAAGNLTLGGTLDITDSGGLAAGSYTLINYAGALNYNLPTVSMPSGWSGLVDTGTPNVVKLTVSQAWAPGDVNHDHFVNSLDIDAEWAAINSGSTDLARYDLNNDGKIDGGMGLGTDVSYLVHTILKSQYGDADLSGIVDSTDYLTWLDNTGQTGGWAQANFHGSDNIVGSNDYVTWLDNVGWPYTSGPSVPEPATMALLALGGLAILRRNRK